MLKISQRVTYMQAFNRSSMNTPDKKIGGKWRY